MLQGYIRKKDVQMSRLGVYISIVIVLCHSLRLLPNTWEMIQRHQVLSPENITLITVIRYTWAGAGHDSAGLLLAALDGCDDHALEPG